MTQEDDDPKSGTSPHAQSIEPCTACGHANSGLFCSNCGASRATASTSDQSGISADGTCRDCGKSVTLDARDLHHRYCISKQAAPPGIIERLSKPSAPQPLHRTKSSDSRVLPVLGWLAKGAVAITADYLAQSANSRQTPSENVRSGGHQQPTWEAARPPARAGPAQSHMPFTSCRPCSGTGRCYQCGGFGNDRGAACTKCPGSGMCRWCGGSGQG